MENTSKFIDLNFLRSVKESIGYYDRSREKKFDKFAPYGYYEINDVSTMYREYLFFTKPDLNIDGVIAGSDTMASQYPEYVDMIKTNYPMVHELMCTGGLGFMPILTNASFNSDGAEVVPSTALEIENVSNIFGANITYRGTSVQSRYNVDFTVEFIDTKFLDIFMMFHLWDTYSNLKNLGYAVPKLKYLPPNKILEDQISVYKIIVADDYETIVYYGKFTGVYPKETPATVFHTLDGGNIKLPVSFKAFRYDDNDPAILSEFNAVASGIKGKTDRPDKYVGIGTGIERNWKTRPEVVTGKLNGRNVFKLKWR